MSSVANPKVNRKRDDYITFPAVLRLFDRAALVAEVRKQAKELDRKDPALIRAARERLLELLAEYRRRAQCYWLRAMRTEIDLDAKAEEDLLAVS